MSAPEIVKLAWRRDPAAPVGVPASGTFECRCGATIAAGRYGDAGEYACEACGVRVDGRGWVIGGRQ